MGIAATYFTAMIITGAGLALVVPNLVAALGMALLLVAIDLQVRAVEEPHLRRHHGDAYRAYLANVGRFIPRPLSRAVVWPRSSVRSRSRAQR